MKLKSLTIILLTISVAACVICGCESGSAARDDNFDVEPHLERVEERDFQPDDCPDDCPDGKQHGMPHPDCPGNHKRMPRPNGGKRSHKRMPKPLPSTQESK